MIDKKKKRDELMAAQQKLQRETMDRLNYLNGAITLLNELITDEEAAQQLADEITIGVPKDDEPTA